MALFQVTLLLAAVLLLPVPANGNENEAFAALSTTLPEVQKEIVNKHNELRKSVSPGASNMLKMEWSKAAAEKAQKWANQCKQAHSQQEFRKQNTSCGENLFMSSAPMSWSTAIQEWYNEHNDFIYNVGPKTPTAVVGHYTQVVWYSSFRVGCGVAHCPNSALKYFMVCHYCPAGNYVKTKNTPYKQGVPCASCSGHCEDGLCTNGCGYEDKFHNCADMKTLHSCNNAVVKKSCEASCNCEDKIY